MTLWVTKIVISLLLVSIRLLFGILPVNLQKLLKKWEESSPNNETREQRRTKINKGVILVHSAGSGVFLATSFLHVMKYLRFSVEKMQHIGGDSSSMSRYPWVQLALSIGFFLVYFLEEFLHWFINKTSCEICQEKMTRVKKFYSKSYTSRRSVVYRNENQQIENARCSRQFPKCEKRGVRFEDIDMNEIEMDDIEFRRNLRLNKERSPSFQACNFNETLHELCVQEVKKMKNRQQTMHWTLAMIAIATHAVLEGISIGVKNNLPEIWYLFVSVLIPSSTFCFCVGVELVLAKTKLTLIYIQMAFLAVVTPLGICVGIYFCCQNQSMFVYGIFMALAGFSTGTVLYVLFFEVLNVEKSKRVMGINRSICMLGGFFAIAVLEYGDTRLGVDLDTFLL